MQVMGKKRVSFALEPTVIPAPSQQATFLCFLWVELYSWLLCIRLRCLWLLCLWLLLWLLLWLRQVSVCRSWTLVVVVLSGHCFAGQRNVNVMRFCCCDELGVCDAFCMFFSIL